MRYTHGESKTRLYKAWKSMKNRCLSKNTPYFKWYGGRGIKVCDEWSNSYETFREWALLNGYDENLELDRIDVHGDYTPNNCRWIPHHEQTFNRRDTLLIEINGEMFKSNEIIQRLNIPRGTWNNWTRFNIIAPKIKERYGLEVIVHGGKKSHYKLGRSELISITND